MKGFYKKMKGFERNERILKKMKGFQRSERILKENERILKEFKRK